MVRISGPARAKAMLLKLPKSKLAILIAVISIITLAGGTAAIQLRSTSDNATKSPAKNTMSTGDKKKDPLVTVPGDEANRQTDTSNASAKSNPAPSAKPTTAPQASKPAAAVVPANPVPTSKTPAPANGPIAPIPMPSTPTQVSNISITLNASGCSTGTRYIPYSYVMNIQPGNTAISPVIGWEYEPDYQISVGLTMPLAPVMYSYPGNTSKILDTVPLHYGFVMEYVSGYRIRMTVRSPNVVYSNWVTIPRAGDFPPC